MLQLSVQIFDLLANRSELVLREDGYGAVQVVGLSERVARCAEDVMTAITEGQFLRRTTATHVSRFLGLALMLAWVCVISMQQWWPFLR
jgi:preprotein translocase subunit SecG